MSLSILIGHAIREIIKNKGGKDDVSIRNAHLFGKKLKEMAYSTQELEVDPDIVKYFKDTYVQYASDLKRFRENMNCPDVLLDFINRPLDGLRRVLMAPVRKIDVRSPCKCSPDMQKKIVKKREMIPFFPLQWEENSSILQNEFDKSFFKCSEPLREDSCEKCAAKQTCMEETIVIESPKSFFLHVNNTSGNASINLDQQLFLTLEYNTQVPYHLIGGLYRDRGDKNGSYAAILRTRKYDRKGKRYNAFCKLEMSGKCPETDLISQCEYLMFKRYEYNGKKSW